MSRPSPEEAPPGPGLARRIGRLGLTALVFNGVVGSAIFGLPATVGKNLGRGAPWAWAIAAALIVIVVACFAEVASRFRDAGGPYLYVHATYGRFLGLQTGWMAYLTRLTASAAVANLFVSYLGVFLPGSGTTSGKLLVLSLLLGGLGAINCIGVGPGARVSSVFAALKLLGLAAFIVGGLLWLGGMIPGSEPGLTPAAIVPAPTPPGVDPWLAMLLVLVFAYGGFETALIPLAEARNPEKDAPVALFSALAAATVVYLLAQAVVTYTLQDPGGTATPLADAARTFLGNDGARLIAATALLSTLGYLAGGMVNCPRLTFAMAERRELPGFFASVHPRFRTPIISIVTYAVLVWLLAASGSFLQNVSLSVAARLVTYGLVCGALPLLRSRDGTARGAPPAAFRLPAGQAFAALGVLGMLVMASQVSQRELLIMGILIVLASLHYLVVRQEQQPAD